MRLDDWFLTAEERGNPSTEIDRRHRDGKPWTEGNDARLLVHGSEYFRRLYDVLRSLEDGDWIHFTDWRGDPDERLAGEGTAIAKVLADAAARGVHVRGLIWRSHPDQAHFSEQENLHLAETVNEAGGEVLLDERVRRGGSHHQKLFVIRRGDRSASDSEAGASDSEAGASHSEAGASHSEDGASHSEDGAKSGDVAFVGGIDLCHGRNDDRDHNGDPQAIDLDPSYGPRPPWHDLQLEVRGPAVADIAYTFRERWEDPSPLDSGAPWRRRLARVAGEPRRPDPLPPAPDEPPPTGSIAVQVLRTYPKRRRGYPFAVDGERSIARAYRKVFARAQSIIYVEDQYLWSQEVAETLASALETNAELRLVAIVPRRPDRNGPFTGPPYRIGQDRALETVCDAGGDRVAVYDLEAPSGWPVYVHAKLCVVDDVWAIVGSDNLNIRSWTHDSELSCALLDERLDDRDPRDPGGRGDGARQFARDARLRLWCEHLGRDDDDDDLVDPVAGFDVLRDAALALEGWHATGCVGPRPRARLRVHQPQPVSRWAAWWAEPLYRLTVDPDGRPRAMRKRHQF